MAHNVHPSLSFPPSSLVQGNNKDIQQLFSAVDHRIEALKLNAQHSSGESSVAEKEAQLRVSHDGTPSDEEEDKESVQGDTPSSPESAVEGHTADFREKAVSLPSDNSGCEEGEGQRGEEEREREETEGGDSEEKQSVDDSQQTSRTASGTK